MRNKVYWLIGCFGLCFIQNEACAQAQLHTSITSISDANPTIGDQISINIQLKNESTTDTFNGVINFDLADNNGIITDGSIVGKPNYSGTSIILAPLETKLGLFTVQIQASYFIVGPDIIIVWPIASADILDSARVLINIKAVVGINEEESDKLLLRQNGDRLFIQLDNSETGLQDVRIYSISGQLMVEQLLHKDNNTIPIENLPRGIYVAEIKLRNGDLRRLKWVR